VSAVKNAFELALGGVTGGKKGNRIVRGWGKRGAPHARRGPNPVVEPEKKEKWESHAIEKGKDRRRPPSPRSKIERERGSFILQPWEKEPQERKSR